MMVIWVPVTGRQEQTDVGDWVVMAQSLFVLSKSEKHPDEVVQDVVTHVGGAGYMGVSHI